MWNNSDTFRELIQNNTTHFLSEFMPNNIYWHFRRVTIKQYYTHFSRFISRKNSYQTIFTPAVLLSNSKVILFSITFYQSKLRDNFRELLPNTTNLFHKDVLHNTSLSLSLSISMWTYSKSLLTGMSAESSFTFFFSFQKVQNSMVYSLDIYYFFVMIISIYLSQICLTNQEWTLMSSPGLLHVAV